MVALPEGKILPLIPRETLDNYTETIGNYPAYIPSIPPEPSPEQYLKIIEASGSFDFWNDPEEDIYSLNDGNPI